MDEMTRLRDMRADTPTPDRSRLAAGRRRLADETAKRSRSRMLRTDWRLASLGAAAAAVVTILIGVQLQSPGGDGPSPAASSVITAPDLDDPVALLHRIADAAEARPDPEPRVGQWVYTKVYEPLDEGEQVPPPDIAEELGMNVGPERESWNLYADPQFENGNEGDDHSHRERYEFLAALPADPQAALAQLREFYPAAGPSEARNAHNSRAVRQLVGFYPAPPEGLARLYRAMATIEGVSAVDHLVDDARGHKVIAVHVPQDDSWSRNELLFDPQTLAYVGSRSVAVADDPFDADGTIPEEHRRKEGDVFDSAVVLRTALVGEEGQRP